MTLLEHLPNEIWVEILSNLRPWQLASPCLVSRRMCGIAYPLLYKEPHLQGERYPSTLSLFLRTVLAPGGETLARHVRALHITWDYESLGWGHPDLPCFIAALARFGFQDGGLTGSMQVMLLLHLVPQLQALDLSPFDKTEDFDYIMENFNALQPVASLPVGLQSLRELSWEPYTSSGTVSAGTLLRLLNLPHIRAIDIPLHRGISLSSEETVLAAGLKSSVKELTFRTARMSNTSLTSVLAVPRALTHFRYYARSVTASFDYRAFGLALRQQRTTLVTLVVDFVYRPCRELTHQHPTWIGSFHDWHALTSLTCTLLALFGTRRPAARTLVNVLPIGICQLEIMGDNYWAGRLAVRLVVALLKQKEAVVPRLERAFVHGFRATTTEMQEQLLEAGREAGVQVEE